MQHGIHEPPGRRHDHGPRLIALACTLVVCGCGKESPVRGVSRAQDASGAGASAASAGRDSAAAGSVARADAAVPAVRDAGGSPRDAAFEAGRDAGGRARDAALAVDAGTGSDAGTPGAGARDAGAHDAGMRDAAATGTPTIVAVGYADYA